MARSTVSHYKSRQDDPQGVGHDLHVDVVLTGRVVEHGSELHVDTELVIYSESSCSSPKFLACPRRVLLVRV